MKIKGKIFLLLLAGLVFGCKSIDKLLTFTVTDQTSFRVESTSPLNLPFEILTPDVTTNSSQKFENNNTTSALVKDVKLEELRLTITNPSTKTFSFLKSVYIYISTTQSDEIQLAYLDNISSTNSTITLITTQEKLDKYVKSSSYKLRTKIVTSESLSQPVDVRVDLKFKVTAQSL
jgi:hypothetical protein